ncbi:MAG: MFS transporter [Methanomicrobiales archaeon]|jgi:MFS family permease|nr:MFS transporter [Methanomicrobiales archaeon]
MQYKNEALNTPQARKRALYVLSLAVFTSLIGIGIVVPFLSVFAGDLGAAGFWIGAVFAAFSLSRTVAMPYFGNLSDRVEKKKILAVGLGAYAAISLGYIFVVSVEGLVFLRLLHGLSSAMVAPVAMAYLGELAAPGEEGQFMGMFQGVTMLGFGAGPLLGGIIYAQYGFNEAFYALTGFSALACFIIIALLPPMSSPGVPYQSQAVEEKKPILREYRTLLADYRILSVCVFSFIIEIAFISLLNFLPLFMVSISLGAAESGIAISLAIILSGILQSVFGRIANGAHRVYLIIGGGTLFGVGFLLLPFSSSFLFVLGICICIALGLFFTTPAMNVYLVDVGHEFGMGTTMGVYSTLRGCGDIVGPLLAGALLDVIGVAQMYSVMGMFCLAGTVIFIILFQGGKKKKREKQMHHEKA